MKINGHLKYFFPVFFIIFSWVSVYLVRALSFPSFIGISESSSLYLIAFVFFFFLGSVVGGAISINIKYVKSTQLYEVESVKRNANLLIALSILVLFLLVYKFLFLFSGTSFSLSEITELRLTRGRDPSDIKGGMLSGVLGTAFSGFTIIAYLYKDYFFSYLTAGKRVQLIAVFILGILVSFLSGGRWGAAIAILIVIFSRKNHGNIIVMNTKRNTGGHNYKNSSFFKVAISLSFLIFILYVFSYIFLDRAVGSNYDIDSLFNVLNNNLPGLTVSESHKTFIQDNPSLGPAYFVISLFQYYIGHSFYQFDVLLSAQYPENAPYFLAYQGYLHASILNKFGFTILPINSILEEIVNPGVYFTLAGSFYLDFGYWGGLIAIFISSFIGTYYWVRFIRCGSFFDTYIAMLFLLFIVFSPIVSIVSTGIYPSLLTLVVVLNFFIPKKVFLRTNYEKK